MECLSPSSDDERKNVGSFQRLQELSRFSHQMLVVVSNGSYQERILSL